jgi:hypothetical protein
LRVSETLTDSGAAISLKKGNISLVLLGGGLGSKSCGEEESSGGKSELHFE